MNREELVVRVADILPLHRRINPPGGECSCGHVTPLGGRTTAHVAQAVLDAILPQVSTVAEIEALPDGTVVTDVRGEAWKNYTGTAGTWYGTDLDELRPVDLLAHRPLTVVWQPEVTA